MIEHLGKFSTILADYPWPSASHKGKRDNWIGKNMRPRYHTMTRRQVLDFPLASVAADDCILVMWATWMHLGLAMEVIEAQGFTYCAGMPWLKIIQPNTRTGAMFIGGEGCPAISIPAPIYGPGIWFQGCTEPILIARKGHPKFEGFGNPRPARKGIIIAPRDPVHSKKPGALQDWMDEKFPGPKLELFAREQRAGWTCWGDEL